MAQQDSIHKPDGQPTKLIQLLPWRLDRIKPKHLRLPTPALSREINTDIQSPDTPSSHPKQCIPWTRTSYFTARRQLVLVSDANHIDMATYNSELLLVAVAVCSISYCPSLTGHCMVLFEVSLNKHPDSDFSDRRFRNAFRGITNCSLTLPCIYHILSAEV